MKLMSVIVERKEKEDKRASERSWGGCLCTTADLGGGSLATRAPFK